VNPANVIARLLPVSDAVPNHPRWPLLDDWRAAR